MKLQIVAILNPATNFGEEIVDEVKEFCENKSIIFTAREYDSLAYAKDRDYVESLPAFHIYYGETYMDTFHKDYVEHIHIALSTKVRTFRGVVQRFVWRIKSLYKSKV